MTGHPQLWVALMSDHPTVLDTPDTSLADACEDLAPPDLKPLALGSPRIGTQAACEPVCTGIVA
jgi:hypothetical protein